MQSLSNPQSAIRNPQLAAPSLPIVSIIGRPNVGKSTLVNRIAGRRAAVVDDQPGVTRDRNYIPAQWCGRRFLAVDTGGLAPSSRESIARCIQQQVDTAIAESAAIVFVVEAGVAPTADDLRIATRLRKLAGGRLILAVNKVDAGRRNLELAQYLSLGCGEPLAISALHGLGVGDLLDCIAAKLPAAQAESQEEVLRVAVVGRPNAGKSSLVNKLAGADRMIVDAAPGTTRDAVDSELLYQGRRCVIIDTAGLRAKSRVIQDVEYYCNLRAISSIKRCDVSVLVIDASHGLGEQDLKIVEHVCANRKGLVVCWNKWDIVQKKAGTFDQISADARNRFPQIRFAPMVAVSALTGQRVHKVLDLALEVQQKMRVRIPQAELEDHVMEWSRTKPHPMMGGVSVRILGAKQRPASFPFFVCYASHAEASQPSYCRYLENKIHETYDFAGCPVIVEFRNAARAKRR